MTDPTIWNNVRGMIRDQELLPAIEALEQWVKARSVNGSDPKLQKWLDELTLHYAAVKRQQVRYRKRLSTREQSDVELAQISESVLALLQEIRAEDDQRSASVPAVSGIQLPAAVPKDKLEQITGKKSRLLMVSWLERGLWCSTAVCRLVSASRIGSGFRVYNDLIVTNNHVIPDCQAVEAFSAEFFYEEDLNHILRKVVRVQLDPLRFWTSLQLDLTVIGADFSHNPVNEQIHELTLQRSTPDIGDPVSIIQHPLGGPKQIALTSNEIINTHGHLIHYVTDTLPGSSGSPVFNADWEVIAVHHAGGMVVENAAAQKIYVNEGILTSALMACSEVTAGILRSESR